MSSDRISPVKRRVARISLDVDTLHQLLRLPEGMRILAEHLDAHTNSLVLFIESEALPECESGQVPPEIWLDLTGWHTPENGDWFRAEIRIPDHVQRAKEQEQGGTA